MERTSVKSSNIKSVGYDEPKRTLEIEFNNGAIYQYNPFQAEAYHEFMASDSKGKWFHKNIKTNDRLEVKTIKSSN